MSDLGYDSDLFALLERVEPTSFWFRARRRLIVSTLARFFPQPTSLLEVGCGNGFVLAAIRDAYPHARLVGIDLFDEALVRAREQVPDAEFRRLDALELPFESEFDVVCALDVLEHLDDDRPALERMRSALRPGGGLILLVPQHQWLWSGADIYAHHRRRYSRAQLVDRVQSARLEILFVSSFVTSLLPAMALSRLAQRITRRPYDLVRELTPGPLNGLFVRLLDLERRLIVERRRSLPVGGSLLVVARRPIADGSQ